MTERKIDYVVGIQAAARFCGCAKQTVYSMLAAGEFPKPQIVGDHRLFDKDKLRRVKIRKKGEKRK